MAVKFNPFTGQLQIDEKGSGGGSSYIDGEVQNFSALPETLGSPAVDSAYLVREAEGTWLLNRKPAGIYIRTANTGTRASDWTYAGEFPDVFSDANFVLYDNADSTKNLQFQLSGIDTATTRTLTVPNASGTIVIGGAVTTSGLTQATDRILGRTTASTGAIEELSATSPLALSSGAIKIDSGASVAGAALEANGSGGASFVAPRTVTKTKTADTGRTSTTTYADDDHLAGWTLDADSNYRAEFFLKFTATANGGLKALILAASMDNTATRTGWIIVENNSLLAAAGVTSTTQLLLAARTAATNGGSWAGTVYFRTGSTGGTASLQWAQNASSADTTTLKEGSFVSITKMS